MELMLLQTAISGVGSLLQKLYQRFQQAKVTDAEFNELQEFMSYVQIHSGTCTSYGANTALKQKLEDTNKKLEDWSSENSRFLSRSSDERVRELHALRESVKLVIDMEIFKMLRSIYGNAKNPAGNVKNPAGNAKNPAGKTQPSRGAPQSTHSKAEANAKDLAGKAKPSRGAPQNTHSKAEASGSKVNTNIVSLESTAIATRSFERTRSKNTGWAIPSSTAHTFPRRPQGPANGKSNSVDSVRQHSNEKKHSTQQLRRELWVPIDSDKQANDVKAKLTTLPGVKEVFCDQATHKVSVMLREGREYNYRMATLIEYARQEDPYKLPPKRWEDRPK